MRVEKKFGNIYVFIDALIGVLDSFNSYNIILESYTTIFEKINLIFQYSKESSYF